MAKTQSPLSAGSANPHRGRRETARLALAVVLTGLVVAFALLNLDRVEVNWILGTARTPLILVIVVSLLAGAGLGALAARRVGRR